MGRFRVLWALLIAFGVAFVPAPAFGEASVLLGYGQSYEDGGAIRTHRGIDLAACEGDTAASFIDGEVSFAGRIPSDSGGSVLAVTVRTDDALVTIHPLDECWVKVGERVSVGEGLGTVSGSGDSSSGSTHLHLSVRIADVYTDPSYLLVATTPPSTGAVELELEEPAPAPAPEPVVAPAAVVVVPSPVAVQAPTLATPRPGVATMPEVTVESADTAEALQLPAPEAIDVQESAEVPSVGAHGVRRSRGIDTPDLSAGLRGLLAALAAGAVAFVIVLARRGHSACVEVQ